jgi:hypothetical protein
LNLFGNPFGAAQHYTHATAKLVTQHSIKIHKMIDMSMADKYGSQIQTVLFSQQASGSAFTEVLPGVIVDAQLDTNVFSGQVF